MKHLASPESRILPEITWDHLQPQLIQRLRDQAGRHNPQHVWVTLTNAELVRDAGLSVQDPLTGETGFTAAALLLLGSKEAIRANLPLHGTQAVFRPGNWRRGEREEVRTNLLESYDRLMAFGARHLPGHLETPSKGDKGETFDLRDAILSEIFTNSLMFRDYGKSYPARFVIEADRVFLENGMVAPSEASGRKGQKSSPNPLIANVFKQIGWAAAAKSSQVSQWSRAYFGILPRVVEGSVYRILAPFPNKGMTFPAADNAWDISDMLATQAPWTHSKAAQNEVDLTRGALDTLIEGPILSDVENMQIPAPIEGVDIFGRPLPKTGASPALESAPAPAPKLPDVPAVPVHANGHLNGHANGHAPEAAKPSSPKPDLSPSVHGVKNQAVIQTERMDKILEFCKTPRYRSEVQAHVGIVNRDYFRKDILNPMIEKGLLHPTLPDKPNSPKQQYRTVA